MWIIIIKIIMWVIIFLYTMLTIMTIKDAIENGDWDTALIACAFDFTFILYGILVTVIVI